MIGREELARRARDLGLQEGHVEHDYVLQHVLAAVSRKPGSLIFRGGTALARVYWPDFRLSEDLDFIVLGSGEGVAEVIGRAIRDAAKATGLPLTVDVGHFRRGRARSLIQSESAELLVDVVSDEQAALPVRPRDLRFAYSDLEGRTWQIPVLDLAEILGTKWNMLDDASRREPRDLFDIWWALEMAGVSFEEVARGHRARFGHEPLRQFLNSAKRLEPLWEQRLRHQMAELPSFVHAHRVVAEAFAEWSDGEPELLAFLEAALAVLREEGEPLHWTKIQDLALKRGHLDPFSQPDIRKRLLAALAYGVRVGSLRKGEVKGTYELGETVG